jgi:hypothetical protein
MRARLFEWPRPPWCSFLSIWRPFCVVVLHSPWSYVLLLHSSRMLPSCTLLLLGPIIRVKSLVRSLGVIGYSCSWHPICRYSTSPQLTALSPRWYQSSVNRSSFCLGAFWCFSDACPSLMYPIFQWIIKKHVSTPLLLRKCLKTKHDIKACLA